MERNSAGNNSFESSSDVDDSSEPGKSSKKKSLRLPLAPPASEKPSVSEQSVDKAEKPQFTLDTIFEADKEKPTESVEQHVSSEKNESTMTPEETTEVATTIAQEHLAAMQEVDQETAEAIAPAGKFLEKVEAGQDVDAAFQEVAADLGMSQEEIDEALAEMDGEGSEHAEASHEMENAVDGQEQVFDPQEEDEGELDLRTASAAAQTASSNGSGAAGSSTGSGGSGSGSGSGSGGSAGGSGGGTVPPSGGSSGASGAMPVPAVMNTYSQPGNFNAMPAPAAEHYGQRRRAGELLLVGAVGYLIGRRRGRIKTEKRMKPVRQRLEKQVRSLEEKITYKEQQLVIAKARLAERAPVITNTKVEARPAPRQERVKAPVERTQPSRVETRIGIEKPVQEQLGKIIMAAEAPKKIERPSSIRKAFKAEEVPTMARNDLLELSEKILVEGASLRRIYESRLISEKQLRYLVSEYLQGKDIAKDLRREMVEHEIDFERDPILRDRVRSQLTNDGGKSGLGQLLKSVGVVEEGADPVMQKRIEDEERIAAERYLKKQRQRAAVDVAMVTVIVGLATLVTVLVFRG